MKLAISNIGWTKENDTKIYQIMQNMGYSGLEIAPTRIFPDAPYEKLAEANIWSAELNQKNGLCIPSMQSIWYGRDEKLFGTDDERIALVDYTKKAILFAEAIGCKNLVFGCPRNRQLPDSVNADCAIAFFRELGEYAAEHNTVIGMEANPPIYNTNYINTTEQALELIRKVNSKGFLLNLDVGTMIQNDEPISILKGNIHLINHVHVSEPGLKKVEKRDLHFELKKLLMEENYAGYISVEMGNQENVQDVCVVMNYVKEIFG